MIKTIQENC